MKYSCSLTDFNCLELPPVFLNIGTSNQMVLGGVSSLSQTEIDG